MSARVEGAAEDCHVAKKFGERGTHVPNSSEMVRVEKVSEKGSAEV